MKKRTKKILIGASLALCAVIAGSALLPSTVADYRMDKQADAYVQAQVEAASLSANGSKALDRIVLGDANVDGTLSLVDVRTALRGCSGIDACSERQLMNTDFDRDGAVSLKEVRMILMGAADLEDLKASVFGISGNSVTTDKENLVDYCNLAATNVKLARTGLTVDHTYYTKFAGGVENPYSIFEFSKRNAFNNNADLNTLKNDTNEYTDTVPRVTIDPGETLVNSFPTYGAVYSKIPADLVTSANLTNNGDGTYTAMLTFAGESYTLPTTLDETSLGRVFPMLLTKSQYREQLENTDCAQYIDYITGVSCAYSDCTITFKIDASTDTVFSAVYLMPYKLTNTMEIDGDAVTLDTDIRDIVTYTVG